MYLEIATSNNNYLLKATIHPTLNQKLHIQFLIRHSDQSDEIGIMPIF